MLVLLTLVFWRNLAWSLLRTALTATLPFLPSLSVDFASAWRGWVLTVGLALVVAVLTSLSGIPDPAGVPWWQVLVARALRQFGQVLAGAIGSAALLTDVAWGDVLPLAAQAAVGTLVLTALLYLPKPTSTPMEV